MMHVPLFNLYQPNGLPVALCKLMVNGPTQVQK